MNAKKHNHACQLIGLFREQTDSGYSWAVSFYQNGRVIWLRGFRSLEKARTAYTRWKGKS